MHLPTTGDKDSGESLIRLSPHRAGACGGVHAVRSEVREILHGAPTAG
jgi:hypothetical protein